MVEIISEQAPDFDNYIFGADLNTTPYTKAARTLRQSGLTNAGPALKHPTWTTKPFAIGPWEYSQLRWRFDYVLSKRRLRSGSRQILDTQLSDHLPILVEFETEK